MRGISFKIQGPLFIFATQILWERTGRTIKEPNRHTIHFFGHLSSLNSKKSSCKWTMATNKNPSLRRDVVDVVNMAIHQTISSSIEWGKISRGKLRDINGLAIWPKISVLKAINFHRFKSGACWASRKKLNKKFNQTKMDWSLGSNYSYWECRIMQSHSAKLRTKMAGNRAFFALWDCSATKDSPQTLRTSLASLDIRA